ncbi:hypothetical protein GGS23DRAFT_612247 [Durotheca rogersii]|uniref:uncharacterized protein n=1 Tax=Durotheca rogersii TaxID=419775 RepID=UPI00221F3E66|nr:uncharacterized protein GGS23DRAFT_612247 [Durotheca rogersii]KAI5861285.1 hypothetical protein GGS23DRAFT_612247 [Durotheca rogersii]
MAWTRNVPDDTPTDGPVLVAVASALTGLSLCFIFLRGYVRGILLHAVGIDDWAICITWSRPYVWDLPTEFRRVVDANVDFSETTWGLGLKNIDDIPDQNVYMFGLIAMQWDTTVTDGKCIDRISFYLAMASLTIVLDFCVMFLPFPVLTKSKIQTRSKVVLLGLFALGLFVTATQVVRIQFIRDLSNRLNSASLIQWSTVEINLGIVVACVPALQPILKKFRGRASQGSSPSESWRVSGAQSASRRSWGIAATRGPPNNHDDDVDHLFNRAATTESQDSMRTLREMEPDITKQVPLIQPARLSHASGSAAQMRGWRDVNGI